MGATGYLVVQQGIAASLGVGRISGLEPATRASRSADRTLQGERQDGDSSRVRGACQSGASTKGPRAVLDGPRQVR